MTALKAAFGTSLDDYLAVGDHTISPVIQVCVACLLDHVEEEGLFRIPGSTSKVKKLKYIFDAGIVPDDIDEFTSDPHAVAGTLKCYLRELPEPLLTYVEQFAFETRPLTQFGIIV